jgi:hypothetical protein
MKRTKKKKKISRRIIPMPIYTSPDGGETVYEQLPNGERKLVEQSQQARDNQTAYDELDMMGTEAIALRRKHPALQKAWDQYRTIWHLINDNE